MARLRWLGPLFICFVFSSFAQIVPPAPATPEQQASPVLPPAITLIPRSHEERENSYRLEHRVVLNVFVSDASGKPVTGLNQEDFTLLDNGQPRKLASFRSVRGSEGIAPVRIMLLLDAIDNSPKDVTNDSNAIKQYLKRSPGRLTYQTSVGILSGSGARFGRLSQDRDALLDELKTLAADVHQFNCTDERGWSEQVFTTINLGTGTTVLDGLHPDQESGCLNQRFQQSVSALKRLAMQQEDVPGRVILIWIGVGWPSLSNREFRADSAAIKRNFFDNLVEVSTELREAQITLDAVFSPDLFRRVELRSDHDNAFFNGVPTEDEVTAGSMGLQVLAHQSGGRILTESKDIGEEIVKCVADAESYYVLSLDSPPATRPGDFHSLEVKVNKLGSSVRTNTAYYAQP